MIDIFDNITQADINHKVFLGFDGFIDKIYKPMKIKSRDASIPFKTTVEFSGYLSEKAGKSISVDLELIKEKIGGNMPIAASALSGLGCRAICLGAMGRPEPNPIFIKHIGRNSTLISVENPGYCDALEFEDGKLMLAANNWIDCLDYQKITEVISERSLIEYFEQCDAFAFLNWGELIHSNDIWENFYEHIVLKCKFPRKRMMLVDFSDFSKRSPEEVNKMCALLEKYSEIFDLTVSVNDNELGLLVEKLKLGSYEDASDARIIDVSERLRCKHFVVHLFDTTKYVKGSKVCSVKKEVIKNPKVITGGGDNFNAGLLFGLLLGADIEDAVRCASALSCLYVRHGESVDFQTLKNYLKEDRYGNA